MISVSTLCEHSSVVDHRLPVQAPIALIALTSVSGLLQYAVPYKVADKLKSPGTVSRLL